MQGHTCFLELMKHSIFLKHMSNMYLSFVDIEKGSIQGNGIRNQDMSDMVFKDYCFKTRELWSLSFPSELEKTITTTTKFSNEVIFLFMLQLLPKIILTMYSFPWLHVFNLSKPQNTWSI